jgi:hypothetical protein
MDRDCFYDLENTNLNYVLSIFQIKIWVWKRREKRRRHLTNINKWYIIILKGVSKNGIR